MKPHFQPDSRRLYNALFSLFLNMGCNVLVSTLSETPVWRPYSLILHTGERILAPRWYNMDFRLSVHNDNPEWTDEDVKTAVRMTGLPLSLQRKLRGQRGPQKAPCETQTAARYDADIIEAFKEGDPGWQTRMSDALCDWLKTGRA